MSQPNPARPSSDRSLESIRVRRAWIAAAFAVSSGLAAPAAVAQSTTRASLGPANQEGNAACTRTSMSGDARYVAFVTKATNFGGVFDVNGAEDVFLRDRQSSTTKLISHAFGSKQAANGASPYCAITRDGTGIVFTSDATDLVATPDTNGKSDIFYKDLVSGSIELVSVSTSGVQSNLTSFQGFPSANGRYVAFTSVSSNFVPGVLGTHVYLRDRQFDTTTLISQSSAGVLGNEVSTACGISEDGRFVVFWSKATNLINDDFNNKKDVYLRDRNTATTSRVSYGNNWVEGNGDSTDATISADGRYVAFRSMATNLTAQLDSNANFDVYVRDRILGVTTLASKAFGANAAGNGQSRDPRISADGRHCVFASGASNLMGSPDTNNAWDVYMLDLLTSTTTRLSVGALSIQANGASPWVGSISTSGRYVDFISSASNLQSGDSNLVADVYVRDRMVIGHQ